jgi:hypothetical protein
MREEEKMAKDVYITLYNKWAVNIFTNISASKQRRMKSVFLAVGGDYTADSYQPSCWLHKLVT